MAQHDMIIDNAPGIGVRQDINAAIAALASNSSGPVEPTVKYPGMLWLDTSVAPNGLVRQRNLANDGWIPFTASALTPGQEIHALPDKAIPADADEFPLSNSASTPDPWERAKMTYANLKAAVIGSLGLNIHGAAAKAVLVDADEFGIADSVSTPTAWGLKRHTWANLKSMIGIAPNQRLAPINSTGIADCNLALDSGWYFVNGTTTLNAPLAGAAGHGYLQVFQQSSTAPNSLAHKQIWYEAQGDKTFTRQRWYAVGGTWSAWTAAGGAAATFIGDAAPPTPVAGQLWWESDSGDTFIWYDDGNTQQWVQQNVTAVPPAAPFTKSFESAQLTFTSGSNQVVAHNLGVAPILIQLQIVCVTADTGYAVGDRVFLYSGAESTGATAAINMAVVLETADPANNLKVVIGDNGTLLLFNKGTGVPASGTLARWRLIVRAWA